MNQNSLTNIGGIDSGRQQDLLTNQQTIHLIPGVEPSLNSIHHQHHHTTFVPPHSISSVHLNQTNSSMAQQHSEQTYRGVYFNGGQSRISTATPIIGANNNVQIQQNMRNKRLQVEDALSYLERVRQQFMQTPEKYNEFLEVMKEFKSHTIDTHGVILRVTKLFRFNPDLIDGFNTFLPPGFEVHVSGDFTQIREPNGSNKLINNAIGQVIEVGSTGSSFIQQINSFPSDQNSQVSQTNRGPASIVIRHQQSPSGLSALSSPPLDGVASPQSHQIANNSAKIVQTRELQNYHSNSNESSQQIGVSLMSPTTAAQQLQIISEHQNALTISSRSQQQQQQYNSQQQSSVSGQQPIHFDQALGYLNKIKERFVNRPEIYHQFLAILSNYQRADGSQRLTESDVYQEVAKLFHNEEDLMRDFKSFLPDASIEFSSKEQIDQQPLIDEQIPLQQNGIQNECEGENIQEGNVEIIQFDQNNSVNTSVAMDSNVTNNTTVKKRSNTTTTAAEYLSQKKSKTQTKIVYDTSMNKILEEIPLKEFVFFEKVHDALQSEQIFQNFLRYLALYTKSIVSKGELIDLITPFLSSYPELLKQFKDILGGKIEIIRQPNKQLTVEDRLPSESAYQIDFTHTKQLGVSYRCMPTDYEYPICSGRTELCKEVLNDRWVCYPTWSSEDTSSVTSKKSTYEEVMCRTEDERFEVDILIETNSTAIDALQYALRRVEALNNEEAKKWMAANEKRLGCSYTVISRAVKKLYGEYANKILSALREKPVVAIQQVLSRMKAKDTEWQGVRDEYNVIWRDQVEKNYLKSLDHQALTFKTNDVKNIRSRGIINQLESAYDERREKLSENKQVEWGPHLCIKYPSDRQIFYDANELLLHYVKRHLNSREKKGIESLLLSVIPRIFLLKIKWDDQQYGLSLLMEKTDSSALLDTEMEDVDKSGNGNSLSTKDSSKATETNKNNIIPDEQQQELLYVQFFGTNSWVLFIRLHAILCDRLATIKKCTEELVEEYDQDIKFREKQRRTYKKYGDSEESHFLNAVDVHKGLRELKKPFQNPENFYQIMLQEMKNLLDGSVDAASFEDTLRSMFDTRAYILFTMDKLVSTITNHLKSYMSDNTNLKSIELFEEYFKKRLDGAEHGEWAKKVGSEYEALAEKLLINQNCYKMFFFNRENPIITIELIDTNEPGSGSDIDDEDEEEEKESENVIPLPLWSTFLEKHGVNAVQIFLSAKCQKGSGLKRNPRDVPWTVLYRRKHKKGIHADEGQQKKRVKRTVQTASRPVADMTVEALLAQRNQKPEFRKQQREAAIKAAKEAVRAKKEETKRKAAKLTKAAQQPKVKASKQPKAPKAQVAVKR
ncbi:HDAC_interact domain-containing protein [Meloidogyne graminicola]|uniref:HDAC_interact domain-containing protein n=1 Tax=Meloidogyne graminicola TaxID=189291 RepID=A0A8S9ZGK3_9BILA|nr:HDAC_interact domain-containing protein [Meloidogyne graminicola]